MPKSAALFMPEALESRLLFTKYAIQDLGPITSSTDIVQFISSSFVAGSVVADGLQRAYIAPAASGKEKDLPLLSGYKNAQALGVNTGGILVGDSFVVGGSATEATEWTEAGKAIDLGRGQASVINTAGEIVGTSVDKHGNEFAAIFGKTTQTLSSNISNAYGVNDDGVIVGQVEQTGGAFNPFVYKKGTLKVLDPGVEDGQALAINNESVIVGQIDSLAVMWVNYKRTNLPGLFPSSEVLLSTATGINDSGTIVGQTVTGMANGNYATFWSGGSAFNLNHYIKGGTNGWDLEDAISINDAGQIVGTGVLNGAAHSFLLTPVK
jgi:uncharacterized membrane protein